MFSTDPSANELRTKWTQLVNSNSQLGQGAVCLQQAAFLLRAHTDAGAPASSEAARLWAKLADRVGAVIGAPPVLDTIREAGLPTPSQHVSMSSARFARMPAVSGEVGAGDIRSSKSRDLSDLLTMWCERDAPFAEFSAAARVETQDRFDAEDRRGSDLGGASTRYVRLDWLNGLPKQPANFPRPKGALPGERARLALIEDLIDYGTGAVMAQVRGYRQVGVEAARLIGAPALSADYAGCIILDGLREAKMSGLEGSDRDAFVTAILGTDGLGNFSAKFAEACGLGDVTADVTKSSAARAIAGR